jgi:hypothetical protein
MERVKKEDKDKFLEKIRKAGDSENYETSWNEEGTPYKIKYKPNIKKGGESRAKGSGFELKVRKDLENKGRIVDKWTNNVSLEEDKMIISRKFNPFKKMLIIGTGFPDFIAFRHLGEGMYNIIGVEVKINGILSKIEKEKCAWYLEKKIFSQIWIAKKGKKRGEIEYDDFIEKYGNKYNKT